MMDFLNNTLRQFIISSSISIILGLIGIWLTLRHPIQLSIIYETIEVEPVDVSEDEVKEIIEKMQILSDNDIIKHSCFVTFKIWNSGGESITLSDDAKPLTIAFKGGERILDCKKIETIPSHVEVTPKLDAEKVLLVLPLLDPKQSITLRVLLTNYVNYFPEIYAHVPGKKRIVRANNIRSSTENKIAAMVYLCIATLFPLFIFSLSGPFSYRPGPVSVTLFAALSVLLLLAGITLLLMSLIEKRMAPYPFLLYSTLISAYFKRFLRALPGLVIIGIIAAIIYALFGMKVLVLLFLMFFCLVTPLSCWYVFYDIVTRQLRKREKVYNPALIGALTGILSIVFIAISIYMFSVIILYMK